MHPAVVLNSARARRETLTVKYATRTAQACAFTLCIAGFGHAAFAGATIVTFDPSGSVGTYPYGENALGAITGFYKDGSNLYHGFLRTP